LCKYYTYVYVITYCLSYLQHPFLWPVFDGGFLVRCCVSVIVASLIILSTIGEV
jgi:hypothetical protein